MKKILIIALLCLASITSYAKCYRTNAVSCKDNVTNHWSAWKPLDVLFCVEPEEHLITIYTKETQVYNLEYFEDVSDRKETVYIYYATNADGIRCTLRYRVYMDHGKEEAQLYVEFRDITIVYDVTQ